MESGPLRAVIFGTTFLGIGAGLCLEPCVIVESSGLPGAEFLGSRKVCADRAPRPRSALGKRFAHELAARGIVDGAGHFCPAPMASALERLLEGRSVTLRMRARVLRIHWTGDAYRLVICFGGRLETLTAHALLDTTAFGLSRPDCPAGPVQKSLNVLLYSPDAVAFPGLSRNSMSGLYTYAHAVPTTTGRREALESLFALEPFFRRHNLTIAEVAPDFAYAVRPFVRRMGKRWRWVPSTAYAHPVEAFDKGCRVAQKLPFRTAR